MNGLEVAVLLGSAVLAAAVLAPRIHIETPLLLVIFGLVLGFIPELRSIQLPPETVLLLFLPVMLFWESLTTSLRAIRRDFRGILILSTLLVVVSAFGVAFVSSSLGMPWAAALVLGAALAPVDATAAAALGRSLPRRYFMLLKAESLTNDGTALVLFAIAVGLASGNSYSALDITGRVLLSYLGGIASGALVAGIAYVVMRRLHDPIAINIALLLTPFAGYLLAELIGASGVLAVVVAGLILAYSSGGISTAESRRQTESAWPLGAYLLNGALFVLIGLETQALLHGFGVADAGRLLALVVAVWVVLLVIRFAFPQLAVLVIRLLDRNTGRTSYRARVVGAFAGFRGAVSLAIALAVPAALDSAEPFPGREDIVLVTAGVIVLTLLVQGPLLPVVLRWADLPEEEDHDAELRLAELEITTTAAAAVPELAEEHSVSDEVRERLVSDYDEELALVAAKHQAQSSDSVDPWLEAIEEEGPTESAEDDAGEEDQPVPLARNEEYLRLRIGLLERKREALHRLRRSGTIDDNVAREIQTHLDIEELRLKGVEPFA